MGAPSKRAKRIRKASEFDLQRLIAQLFLPRDGRNTLPSWTLEEIFLAREEQMLGQFVLPSRMAEQMRTDDALFTAYKNRLAPLATVPVALKPAPSAAGARIADEAEGLFGANGVGIHPATLANVHGCLAQHGLAFGALVHTPREDGSRIDVELKYWPIEYVRWDPVFRVFKARADPNTVQPGDIPNSPYNEYGFVGGFWIPVVHGDGRWVIFSNHEIEPFRSEDATLLPASLIWARHAFAARDWSAGSKAHGSAKIIGELPVGVPLQDSGGNLSPEAQAFIALLQSMVRDNAPAGIRPAGSKTEFVTNTSTAWQVWSELMLNAEKAAARIYLGTDGTLGTQGGAPGIDIQQLFGVAKTIVEGDSKVISRAINTGIIQPWAAINFGDSRLAPERYYCLPNNEIKDARETCAKQNAAYYAALVDAKSAGMRLTPDYVAQLAGDYGVRVPSFTLDPAADASGGTASPKPGTPPALSLVTNTIKHEGGKWVVYSEDGSKRLGEYKTKAEAVERIRQIEGHKAHG